MGTKKAAVFPEPIQVRSVRAQKRCIYMHLSLTGLGDRDEIMALQNDWDGVALNRGRRRVHA